MHTAIHRMTQYVAHRTHQKVRSSCETCMLGFASSIRTTNTSTSQMNQLALNHNFYKANFYETHRCTFPKSMSIHHSHATGSGSVNLCSPDCNIDGLHVRAALSMRLCLHVCEACERIPQKEDLLPAAARASLQCYSNPATA